MDYSNQYLGHIKELLKRLEKEQMGVMQKGAAQMADAIKEGHSIFVFGASHAGILAQEMFYRTGGLAVVNPIVPKEVMLDVRPITKTSQMERLEGYGCIALQNSGIQKGDVLLLHSVSGRNTIAIDMALEAKKMGITTIAITSLDYSKQVTSRHVCGMNLFEIADIVIDNCGELEDSCMQLAGMKQKIAPTSTIIGAAIVNCLLIMIVERLLEMGVEPPIFHSANVDGGDAFNEKLITDYRERIFYMK